MIKGATALALCAVLLSAGTSAWGVGAIAVGASTNIVADGLAIGYANDEANAETANALALKNCRSFPEAPQRTRDLCRVVHTFQRQCVSVALDPKDGTPGWGWAVAATSREADEQSMRMCRSTAGRDREGFCEVVRSQCDVKP